MDSETDEKSISEMGHKIGAVKLLNKKEHVNTILLDMFEKRTNPDVVIRIGDGTYSCHIIVLQCYSRYFIDYRGKSDITLPENIVTGKGFLLAYDWMVKKQPKIKREGIVELLSAAKFLGVDELQGHCWVLLDDTSVCKEDVAFGIYMDAVPFGLRDLKELMLRRVSKFFLFLVASQDFVELPIDALLVLLCSDSLGVNSEAETFMAAVRWLNENWLERKKHVVEVMKCIRFGAMPLCYMTSMQYRPEAAVKDIIKHQEVKEFITHGIACRVNREYFSGDGNSLKSLLRKCNMELPLSREWLRDPGCKLHHNLNCPNLNHLCYDDFLAYLALLQSKGPQYWKTFEFIEEDTEHDKPCCVPTDED